ncbi:MAG: stage II sporulation protein M [Bacteroidota bacterium]
MREPAFLRKNKDKWQEYERSLYKDASQVSLDPDRMAELYIQLTDDLAYARTFYPKSKTVKYLNGLAARTHLEIYKSKKQKRNRLMDFWVTELPLILQKSQRQLFYAFVVFTFSFLIGTLSALNEETYIRDILSDSYVNMTLQNIDNDDPTAVYKGDSSLSMFLMIGFNNIRVSFVAFALGIFFSLGTMYIMFVNGVMLGSFLTLFYREEVLSEALPIIYIHGTLEISAIVIAGGAGMMLGNSILFPGTFSRKFAIQEAAKNGVKIIIGLIPVFIMAAFLESFVTRLSEMHIVYKLLIIVSSLAFIFWYYILYPILVAREQRLHEPVSTR